MEYQFDPYGLTVLPPPNPLWKRASAFIAGMIANRLTFYLAKIGAWLPGTQSNQEADPLQQLLEMKNEVERLRPLFKKYSRAAGFKSDGLKWFDTIYASSTEAMEGLSRNPIDADHFEWQYREMQIGQSEESLKDHIKDKIKDAELWLKRSEWLGSPFTKTKKASHSYFFQIGFAFDYLIKTYALRGTDSSVDQSFELMLVESGWKLQSNGQKGLGAFGLPSILAKGLLERVVEDCLGPKINVILEYIHGSEPPLALDYYREVSSFWCLICLKDCENLNVEDRVIFEEEAIVIDNFQYPFDRKRKINDAIVYSFIKTGAVDTSAPVLGRNIKTIISECIPEFPEIDPTKIDPRDRLKKCKKPWAKHFWFQGLCGNPDKDVGEVGYYLNMHVPKTVLWLPECHAS